MTEGTDRTGPAGPTSSDTTGAAPDPAAAPVAARDGGGPDADLVERVVASRVLHRGHYIEFRVDTIERADGSRSERDIAGHPGAVAIVAIDPDGAVLLVRQWRTPAGRVLLEIPAGTLDIDEATGAIEDPDLAARRELEEETGYRAGTWQRLTSFWSAPGFTSELMHVYLATDLAAAHPDERLGPDEDEHLRLERRPLTDALAAVERGEISDAKSIVGLLWVERERQSAASPPGLVPAPDLAPGAIVRTFRMNRADLALANAAVMRRSPVALALGLFSALGAIASWLNGEVFWTAYMVVFTLAFWTGLFASLFGLLATWRYPARMMPEITVSIDARGIDYRSPNASSTTDWASIREVRESGRFFFISFPPVTYVLPLRFFSQDELRTIRRLMAEHGFGPDGRRRPPSRNRGPRTTKR